ncbi:hypothetical protein V7S43_005850 [Phytophthora oleae]|uniref:Tyrosinase copper-binding domain-containing protein n=1 Tax=Phytophthora oleae TaxID=2107226 RepID=A0ABD3FTZ6_9STRA
MKLIWIVLAGLLALIARVSNVEAQTCGSRLRKDWDMMTATEKTTYRNALRAAMDSGAYIKFVEMHTEMMSEREAHRQCMFTYWHRLLLVAFENMLRGQGAAYACVTVPYFNWIVASARVTSGACNSMGNCMAITRELGGWTTGVQRTLAINGVSNSGRCVTSSPLDRFCQLSSTTGGACARCVPRSDWSTVRVPSTTGYASVRAQVFNAQNIGQMSPNVEGGCHNNVHANFGSTMGTFASPADPIFWSHHAMVDLLHVVFHKCRVGTQRLTFQQKASNPVAWTSCTRRDSSTAFRPTDVVTMRTGERGINPIPGSSDPRIGQYFTGVPNQFAGLMDTRDLGSSSYGYYISGQVATMYTQCDASPTSRKLYETNATQPAMCGVAEDDGHETGEYDYSSENNFPETDYTGQDDGHQDVVIVDGSGNPIDENTPTDAYVTEDAEKKVYDWYDETLSALGGDSKENMDDLERQACMFENVCLGGTKDYSPEFKAIWKVKEPRCKTIVDAILNGTETIQYESWREDMEKAFGCPEPSNSYTTPVYSDSWSSSGSDSWSSSESGSGSLTYSDDSNDTIHFYDTEEPSDDILQPDDTLEPTDDTEEPTDDTEEPTDDTEEPHVDPVDEFDTDSPVDTVEPPIDTLS